MTAHRRWMALAATASLMFLGACGGAEQSESKGASDEAAVAAAEKSVAAASETPATIPVTEPLSGSIRGRTIAYAEPAIPVGKVIGRKLDEAAALLGAKVVHVNIGVTPDAVATGMDEVVRLKPDAVVVLAFEPQTFWSKQAKQLADAGIPTVGIGYVSCDEVRTPCKDGETGSSLALVAAPDSRVFGELQAAKVIAHSGGKAKAVYFGDPQLGNSSILEAGFTEGLHSCKACSVESVDVSVADVGTTLPGQIVSYLQAHPDVDYVSVQYGDFAIGVSQALKAAGLNGVHLITQGSSKAQYDDIAAGGAQIADIPVAMGYMSYVAVDSVARLLLGDEITPEQVTQPRLVMTKDNLDISDDGFWPGVKDYKGQFEALWSKTS